MMSDIADAPELGASRKHSGGGRAPNPAYELFVLGELMERPQHAYKLQEIMQRILGPFHRLSWGTLYPLFRRMEGQGLMTSITERRQTDFHREEHGQIRKQYSLTEAGRSRFLALMLEQGDFTADYRALFAVKLSKFGYLTCEQQVIVLGYYRAYIQAQRDFYVSGQAHVATNPRLSELERPYIFKLADHYLTILNAELAWLDAQITQTTQTTQTTPPSDK